MRWRRFLTLTAAAAAIVLATAGLAQERFDYRVRDDMFRAFAGNEAAFKSATAVIEEQLSLDPDHAEALVWRGVGRFLKARQAFDAGDTVAGRAFAGAGMADVDRALALAPNNIGVLIPGASALLAAARNQRDADRARDLATRAANNFETALAIRQGAFAGLGQHNRGEYLSGLAESWSLVAGRRPRQGRSLSAAHPLRASGLALCRACRGKDGELERPTTAELPDVPLTRGVTAMTIDPREASAALHDIASVERRTREALFYSGSGPIFIMWGVLVACGYAVTELQPSSARVIWLGVSLAGCAATGLIVGLRARVRACETRDHRMIWAVLALAAYGTAWSWLLGPVVPRPMMYAFQPSLFLLGMVLAGLWLGRFFIGVGLVGIALIVIGYFEPEPWLRLWMAMVQSATLILAGVWLHLNGLWR